jgi:hypothetical protein
MERKLRKLKVSPLEKFTKLITFQPKEKKKEQSQK